MSAIQIKGESFFHPNKSEAGSSEKLGKPIRKWIKTVITQAGTKEVPNSSFWKNATIVKHFGTIDCSRSDRNEQLLKKIEEVAAKFKPEPKFDFLKELAGHLSEQQQSFLKAVRDAKASRSFCYLKDHYNVNDPMQRYEIAKIAAAQDGELTSQCIKDYGIENQELLYEIAKIAAAQNGWKTSVYIKNYGIKSQQRLYEIAKIAAEQSGFGISAFIKDYDIPIEEQRYEIAKIAAAQDGGKTSAFIQDYDIRNPVYLYEIAKIAAAQNGRKTSKYIQNYGIDDKERLYEIAKIAVAQEGWLWLEPITNYGLETEKVGVLLLIVYLYNPNRFRLVNGVSEKYIQGEISHPGRHLQETIEKVNDSYSDYVREKQMEWLKLILNGYSCIETFRTHYPKITLLIDKLMDYRDPVKRKLFTISLLRRIFIEKDVDAIESFVNSMREIKLKHAITSMLYFAFIETPKADWYRGVIQKLLINKKCSDDKIWVQKINNGLFALLSCKFLNSDEKHQLLDIMIKMEVPRGKRKDALEKAMLMIESLVNIGQHDKIRQFLADNKEGAPCSRASSSTASSSSSRFRGRHITTSTLTFQRLFDGLNSIFESVFQEEFFVVGVQNITHKYLKTFGKFRNQAAIFSYNASLKTLSSSKREAALEAYRFYIRGVVNGSFREDRYDVSRNPHLKVVFADRKTLRDGWMKGAKFTHSVNSHISTPQRINLYAFFEQKIKTDSHLGENWKKPYPNISGIFSGNKVPYEKLIDTVAKKIEGEKDRQKRQALHVEYCLVKLLQSEDKGESLASNGKLLSEFRDLLGDAELKNDVDALIQSLAAKQKFDKYTVVDTDDPQDLLLCGTEVNGSCQRVNGKSRLNRGLLGYLLNGQTRLVAVKDPLGRIVGRCLLRLLWDKKSNSPALYRERFYINSDEERVKGLLVEMCEMRAQSLKLPLYTSNSDTGKTLTSLGGLAPFEYVDGAGGIEYDEYSITV